MLHAVIMAGGSGTRLWPESRKDFPKQFLTLEGTRSFVQRTADRLAAAVPVENISVVCGEHLVKTVRQQLPELAKDAVLVEPEARNTAACIAYAAIYCLQRDPDATMIVVPADHVISPDSQFRHAVEFAEKLVAAHPEKLITFGIQPTYPAESFGYIERGSTFSHEDSGAKKKVSGKGQTPEDHRVLSPGAAYEVKRFREKPSTETAEGYIESRKYFWNSGIFVWKAVAILEYLKRYAPGVSGPMEKIREILTSAKKHARAEVQRIVAEEFRKVESISIDYAVMEPAAADGKVLVVSAPFAWDDVGSWRAMERIFPQDEQGNTILGETPGEAKKDAGPVPILIDTQSSIFRCSDPQKKVIACVGMKDLGVIVTAEAVLIFDKYQEESVREVTKKLKELGYEEYL